MAVAVSQYATVANWFDTASPRNIAGLNWSTNDWIVVVMGSGDNNAGTLTPSNANLSFGAARVLQDSGSSNECGAAIFAAQAGSSQTSQNISCAASNGGGGTDYGGAAWVISGASGVGNVSANDNVTESAISLSVSAGSIVIYGGFNWDATATKTGATGSGTLTERTDTSNGTDYGIWTGDWVDTAAGTFSFGLSDYTGWTVGHVAIELLSALQGATQTPFVGHPGRNPPTRTRYAFRQAHKIGRFFVPSLAERMRYAA